MMKAKSKQVEQATQVAHKLIYELNIINLTNCYGYTTKNTEKYDFQTLQFECKGSYNIFLFLTVFFKGIFINSAKSR